MVLASCGTVIASLTAAPAIPPPVLTAEDEYEVAHTTLRYRLEAYLEAWRKQLGIRSGAPISLTRPPGSAKPALQTPDGLAVKARLKVAVRQRFLRELERLPPLPKVVHVTWPRHIDVASMKGQPILREGVQRLLEANPGWRVEVSDDADIDDYLRGKLSTEDYELVSGVQIVEKTDLWRLLKMYYEGGVYTDLDRLHNQRFDTILDANRTKMMLPRFVSYGNEAWLANAGGVEAITSSHSVRMALRKQPIIDFTQDFMCSSPGNPAFAQVIRLALARRWVCRATGGVSSFAREVRANAPRACDGMRGTNARRMRLVSLASLAE